MNVFGPEAETSARDGILNPLLVEPVRILRRLIVVDDVLEAEVEVEFYFNVGRCLRHIMRDLTTPQRETGRNITEGRSLCHFSVVFVSRVDILVVHSDQLLLDALVLGDVFGPQVDKGNF